MQTWEQSAHARADRSGVYRAMRAASGRDDCDRCHAPLRGLVSDEMVVSEGVTCDVCHTMRSVVPDPHGSEMKLEVTGALRFGPLCDVEDHYFHKMGCSPLHAQSELCGGCHLWTTHSTGMEALEVLTTFSEWRDGPYAEVEQPCQGCHMAATKGEVAVGWGTRVSASDHGLFGPNDDLRSRAIRLALDVRPVGSALEVELEVRNAGAGHSLPGGLPGRRIVVRTATFGQDGEELSRDERIYAKILVDADGAEVPFYAADRVQSDTRLAADERRQERFSFPGDGVAEVRVEVTAAALSGAVAEALGLSAPEPIHLASARATRESRSEWRTTTQ
jgi:hypothetical protein